MTKPKDSVSHKDKAKATGTAKAKHKAARPRKAKPVSNAESEVAQLSPAEQAFIEATIARGEAACLDPSGALPEGATHELIEGPSGEPVVRRKRFSAA